MFPTRLLRWTVRIAATLSMLCGARAMAAEGPVIEHAPVTSCTRNAILTLSATIRAAPGKAIFEPKVFVRVKRVDGFVRLAMEPVAGVKDGFAAQLPAALTQSDFDYYLEAFDEDGNGPSRKGSPKAPIHVKTTEPPALPPPPPPPPAPIARPEPAQAAPVAKAEPAASPAKAMPVPLEAALPAVAAERKQGTPALKIAGISGVALGGALIVGALVGGRLALGAKADMKAAAANDDLTSYESARLKAERAATTANYLAGSGAVVGLAGGLLWLLAPSGRPVSVSAASTPGGGALVVAGHF